MSSFRCQARHDPTDGRVARKLPVAAPLPIGRDVASKRSFAARLVRRTWAGHGHSSRNPRESLANSSDQHASEGYWLHDFLGQIA